MDAILPLLGVILGALITYALNAVQYRRQAADRTAEVRRAAYSRLLAGATAYQRRAGMLPSLTEPPVSDEVLHDAETSLEEVRLLAPANVIRLADLYFGDLRAMALLTPVLRSGADREGARTLVQGAANRLPKTHAALVDAIRTDLGSRPLAQTPGPSRCQSLPTA